MRVLVVDLRASVRQCVLRSAGAMAHVMRPWLTCSPDMRRLIELAEKEGAPIELIVIAKVINGQVLTAWEFIAWALIPLSRS